MYRMGLIKDLITQYSTVDDAFRLVNALELETIYRPNMYLEWYSCDVKYRKPDEEPLTEDVFKDMLRNLVLMDCADEILRRRERMNISKLVRGEATEENTKWYFVTIGFNDSIVTDENEVKVFNSVIDKILKTKGFENIRFVAEKFRQDGIHRHIHFLIDSDYKKSKIIQYVYQKCKNHVHGQQAVDVKTYKDNSKLVYENYIAGRKRIEKLKFVEMDREWRAAREIRQMDENV